MPRWGNPYRRNMGKHKTTFARYANRRYMQRSQLNKRIRQAQKRKNPDPKLTPAQMLFGGWLIFIFHHKLWRDAPEDLKSTFYVLNILAVFFIILCIVFATRH